MKKMYFLLSFILTLAIFSGCKDEIVTEDDFDNNPPNQLSKFSEIQKNVFSTSCALSGCHAGNNPQANLNLSEGSAYPNLVNVNSFNFPDQKRVLPGNKEESLLYKVLSYNFQIKMPPTGKLPQSTIDSIGVWIEKGAPND